MTYLQTMVRNFHLENIHNITCLHNGLYSRPDDIPRRGREVDSDIAGLLKYIKRRLNMFLDDDVVPSNVDFPELLLAFLLFCFHNPYQGVYLVRNRG